MPEDNGLRSRRERVVVASWVFAMFASIISVALWGFGVRQLSTWQACFPAAALVASLFVLTASLFLMQPLSKTMRIVAPTSLLALVWSLAMAIGM